MEALILKLLQAIGSGVGSSIAEYTLEKGEEFLKENIDADEMKILDSIVEKSQDTIQTNVHDLLQEKISLPF